VCAFTALAQEPAKLEHTTKDGRLAPLLENLGNLHFPVTTNARDAQRFFNQGLTLIYGFNHSEALRSFREAARIDPDCAMAYWGQALALAPNINDSAIGPDREQQGYEAISEAVKRKSNAGAKEQALIEALAARFTKSEKPDRKALNQAYSDAMKKVYARYPKDADVGTLYADAVMNTMPWDYWTINRRPKAGVPEARAALEQAMRADINHPGANHVYIHLMEASNEVDLAVPPADRLGGLVPGAGHLVHMPSHVYIRVGRYGDAAAANEKAILADEDYITQCRAQGIYPAAYYPHNIHFLNAALVMEGRGKEALEAARKVASRHDHTMMHEPGFGFAHLLKTVPVMTMVRFGMWDDVLREPEPPADQVFGRAIHHFARGYAKAARADAAGAKAELAGLKKLAADPTLAELTIFDVNKLDKLAGIAVAMLEAEIARASGKAERAIAGFTRAVELEDSLRYSEPPDWLLPPRQFLADMLVRAGRLEDAERVYREDLSRHRSNGWSLNGLAHCLLTQGKAKEARAVQEELKKSWARADVQLKSSRF
jgi:tetratricopeptide (TPR) repeat protein